MPEPVIGCLALQGCVDRHRPHIEAAGASFKAVKTAKQFDEIDAFILPGGESTTMLKLIENFDLWDILSQQFAAKPVWGICAGSILLAEIVENPAQKSFGVLPVTAIRNGYGRQLESEIIAVDGYDVSFIRAPILTKPASRVEILHTRNGEPTWIRDGKNMASTFHPELTFDFPSPMHSMFVEIVKKTATA
ncbi:MAG: pyridoxal 5'-phosphate synthase glutaminase subunit PdxT [Alphaproteobacteria bacterium]|nr:pyridoxal 5'-phosphate synthase glutaminase subunit PdxT [Alphaproteobacteria bacterium]